MSVNARAMDAAADPARDVRILTFNCWGLKYVSARRRERIDAFARRLEASGDDYDIVALQEVWVEDDYELLKRSVASYLPHAKRWFSGILAGPGLAVFSRWPIESSWIFRFPLNGRPSAFWRGDWYVGKAAGSCVILHPSGYKMEIINAHLHAPYAPSGDASYSCHRASQAWDLSGIVRRAVLSGHSTFVTGDLNARPNSVGMRLLEHRGSLSDAWMETPSHKEFSALDIAKMSPFDQVDLAGVTSDSQLNTWRQQYSLDRAKRLDYIFYESSAAEVISSRVVFTDPEPGVGTLSDHFGLTACFRLTKRTSRDEQLEIPRINKKEMQQLYIELLRIIELYKPTVRFQALWRISHFWLSMAVVSGLLISVWWGAAHNRSYVGFIFIAVAVIVAVSGCVNGLMGFLFGHNERRALREFEEQVLQCHLHDQA